MEPFRPLKGKSKLQFTMCDADVEKNMEREAADFEEMFAEGQKKGLFIDKIKYAIKRNCTGRPYICLCAGQNIKDEEMLLRIPSTLTISPKMINKNAKLFSIVNSHPSLFRTNDRFVNQVNILILIVLSELNKGESSQFFLYFKLVFSLNSFERWQPNNFRYTKDIFLREYITEEHDKVRRLFGDFEQILSQNTDELGVVDWQRFLQITMLIESRYFNDRLDQFLLIPFFDLLNHSNNMNVSFRLDREGLRAVRQKWKMERMTARVEEKEPLCVPDDLKTTLYQLVSYQVKWYDCPLGYQPSTSASNYSDDLNHNSIINNCSNASEELNGKDHDVVVVSDCISPIKTGEELFISYGNRSNFFLLTWYGFCLAGNKYDSFRFFFDAAAYEKCPLEGCRNLFSFVSFKRNNESEIIKVHCSTINLNLLSIIRVGLCDQEFVDWLDLEMVVVSSYRGLFRAFVRMFSAQQPEPANDFQRYIKLYDDQMSETVQKHYKMSGKLLQLLKKIRKNPKFNFWHLNSFLEAQAADKQKMDVLESLLELKEYFTEVLEPLQPTLVK